MKLMQAIFTYLFFTFSGSFLVYAEKNNSIYFSGEQWRVKADSAQIVSYRGKQNVLKLDKGLVYFDGAEFVNGVIEFDISFKEQRQFVGINFRGENDGNYEHFYFRPHQSGNPDATQYTPVFNDVSAWQLYFGKGYSKKIKHKFNEWQHVKLVIEDNNMAVFVEDMKIPFMESILKRDKQKGFVSLNASGFKASAYFADLKITPHKSIMQDKDWEKTQQRKGTIRKWQVSGNFSREELQPAFKLENSLKKTLLWSELESESTGLVNIAKVNTLKKSKDTAFVKTVIYSSIDQVKKLDFGFSDAVKVYLNDNLLFEGNDVFSSRDYRFLGSIGYFDHIYLPLKKGKNELWLAVTENFGGWGVQAKVDNMEDIQFSN